MASEPNIDPKRVFWLFGGDEYYPGGGVHDLQATFDTLEEAARAGRHHDNVCRMGIDRRHKEYKTLWQWWQVLDTSTGEIHEEGKRTWIAGGPPPEYPLNSGPESSSSEHSL